MKGGGTGKRANTIFVTQIIRFGLTKTNQVKEELRMKKLAILALAALLVVAFTVPASALENIFGGYWRTRMVQMRNFDGDELDSMDRSLVDTRTRLYYTAKLNDNLKLVNKFEMDTTWGDNGTFTTAGGTNFGDIGADGLGVEIKNTYADFNVGPVNFLVGIQGFVLGRGFVSDDDASGMKAIWKVNEGLYLPFIWKKVIEGGVGQNTVTGNDFNDEDIDAYVFTPNIYLSKDIKINPYYVFMHSNNALQLAGFTNTFDNLNVNVFGLDFDAKMGPVSFWFTGIKQFGSVRIYDNITALTLATLNAAPYPGKSKGNLVIGDEIDLEGYLVALGGAFDFGKGDVHGRAFYASGEDDTGYSDKEFNAYFTSASNSYYWAEIMGMGTFDLAASNGSCADRVSNVQAINVGVTVKPMDKLAITADLWYAKLAEENVYGEDELGTEVDLKASYKLVEGLTLDVVGAYLFAGDATERGRALGGNGKNETNPYEFGTMLSLSF